MNTIFYNYIESLKPSQKALAREAVATYLKSQGEDIKKIKQSTNIFEVCQDLQVLDIENFVILLINQGGRLIKRVLLSSGGIDQTTVDVRQVLKHCLINNATQLALVHNHPSGNLKPSNEDINITNKIKKACELLNIRLIDHVIIGDGDFYSFHDHGII